MLIIMRSRKFGEMYIIKTMGRCNVHSLPKGYIVHGYTNMHKILVSNGQARPPKC